MHQTINQTRFFSPTSQQQAAQLNDGIVKYPHHSANGIIVQIINYTKETMGNPIKFLTNVLKYNKKSHHFRQIICMSLSIHYMDIPYSIVTRERILDV